MTLLELKEIAKELGIKNISKFKKSQLIEVALHFTCEISNLFLISSGLALPVASKSA